MNMETISLEGEFPSERRKTEEGFKSPTSQACALNTYLFEEGYQFPVCTVLWHFCESITSFILVFVFDISK